MNRFFRNFLATSIGLGLFAFVGTGASAATSDASEFVTLSKSAPWLWPVSGAHRIVRPYKAPPTPYGRGHRGVDLAVDPSEPSVFAPQDATVWFSGVVVDRPVLTLRIADGTLLSFEPVSSELSQGSRVVKGQQVGTVETGHCAVLCLHFGVRVQGDYVSPLKFLGGIPHSVLLPTRQIP